jgi:hypothetical protein
VARQRISGKQIQDGIAALAQAKGWMVCHFSPGRVGPKDKWITNYAYQSKGWPDLFMVRAGRLVAIEVKGDGDSVSAAQLAWLNALRDAGVQTALVGPKEWASGAVERLLA